MFKVIIGPRAEKVFAKLPEDLQQSFFEHFEKLSKNPFGPSVKKIKSTEFGYRLRIGRWCVFFALFSKEQKIEIIDIFLKKGKDDYRKRIRLLK